MGIVLYSNHCPKCNVLKRKLDDASIVYDEVNDIDLMISKGFSQMPMLEADGAVMNFMDANNWISEKVGK